MDIINPVPTRLREMKKQQGEQIITYEPMKRNIVPSLNG